MGIFTEREWDHPIPIAVVIIHKKKDDTILMGKRMDVHEYGLYGLPGGKQKRGELIEKAACRELAEETGLQTNQLTRLGYIDEMIYEHFGAHIFLCQEWWGEVLNLEPNKCMGWEWKLRTDISSMDDRTELVSLIHQADMFYGW